MRAQWSNEAHQRMTMPGPAASTAADLIEGALTVGAHLVDTARDLPDGSITWDRGFDTNGQLAVDAGAFNGRCGEAIFLAALYAWTGDPLWHEASLRAICGVRATSRSPTQVRTLVAQVGCGLTGAGGIAYALARTGTFLNECELLRDAQAFLDVAVSECIAAGTRCDVVNGMSAIVCALAVLDSLGCAVDGRAMRKCIDYITQSAVPQTVGCAWPDRQGNARTGMAHGTSGIVYALLRSVALGHDPDVFDAIIRAWTFEESLFMAEAGLWLEHSGQPVSAVVCRWCQGALGIGLTNLYCQSRALASGAPFEASDVLGRSHRAHLVVEQVTALPAEGLCCGAAGVIDYYLEWSRAFGEDAPEGHALPHDKRRDAPSSVAGAADNAGSSEAGLPVAATPLAEAVDLLLRRVGRLGQRRGEHRTAIDPLGPGLWQGWAGVGYELLRVLDAARFPSLLLLQ